MTAFAARIRSLLDDPDANLGDLLEELQGGGNRPLPRPWSRLGLLAEDEPEAPGLWPEVASALAPLVTSEDSELRLASLQVLGLLACGEARALLLEGLQDSLSVCRVAAIDGLALVPATRQSVDKLVELLGDPKQAVRLHAAAALGQMGDKRAASPLRGLLLEQPNESSLVRQWAAFSLSELGGDVAVEALLEANLAGTDSLSLDLEIRTASRQLGKPLLSALEEASKDEDTALAEQAREALSRLHDSGEDQDIQREAAELVAEGIAALLQELKGKDGATIDDFVSGLQNMEKRFGEEANGPGGEGPGDFDEFDEFDFSFGHDA